MNDGASALETITGHRFADLALLEEALTHPSLEDDQDYQRLEFLGDRVLGLVISDTLYKRHAAAPEGELASRYNALVRRETLAAVAGESGIGAHIRMSRSEETTGGREKPAILADVTEAVIGALYLDGGMTAAANFVERWWRPYIEGQKEAPKDAKTELQEWVQAQGMPTPTYEEVGREGPPHAPVFTMAVTVEGVRTAQGTGPSKQLAEQAAARQMLSDIAADSEAGDG